MASTEGALLEARGLGRRYGRTLVFAAVDLTLRPGEVLLLLGPNGAGKSTLLRLLAGLARPARGTVTLRGVPVAEARRRVGYLAHASHLYDDLTVDENLAFAAQLFGGISGAQLEAAVELVGLLPYRDRPVRQLSRGLTQRVALARATLHDPDLLLLDEPYTGLDQAGAADLTARLRARAAAGRGVVLVGHDPAEGWDAVTRLAILARGGLAHDGPRPATVADAVARYREVVDG